MLSIYVLKFISYPNCLKVNNRGIRCMRILIDEGASGMYYSTL